MILHLLQVLAMPGIGSLTRKVDCLSILGARAATASVGRSDLCLEAEPGYRHSASRKAFTRFSV
jgi:hypothetical protein